MGEQSGFWSDRAREIKHQPRADGGFFGTMDSFLSDSSLEMDSDVDGASLGLDRLVPYNLMLTMYSRSKNADKFFALLPQIESAGLSPDIYTYNALFKLRANRGELEELLQLATDMLEQNIRLDIVSYNILIEALGSRGWAPSPSIGPFGGQSGIASANRVLHMMSRLKIRRDPRTYEVMFNSLFKVDLCEELLALWDEMLLRGTTPTAESCSTVMKAMYRLGRTEEALAVWHRVKNILVDYIRHLEGKGDDGVRTDAIPRPHAKALSSGSWDPVLPTSRTENVILDIFMEQGQLNLFFETWHLFRRADITPLSNSCAAIMEVYLDIGDFVSGINVFQWLERVGIRPTPRSLAVLISLLSYQSVMNYARRNPTPPPKAAPSGPPSFDSIPETGAGDAAPSTAVTHPKLSFSTKTMDLGTLSSIRHLWMSLRAMDTTFHPPQLSTFESVIVAFYSAHDYIGVLDAFKVMQETILSRSPAARAAPSSRDLNDPVVGSPDYSSNSASKVRPPIARDVRHVPPLRGMIDIASLSLVLDSHRRAQYSYGSLSQRLPEDVERVRILLDLEPSPDYERALGPDAEEFLGTDILSTSAYGAMVPDSASHSSHDSQNSGHWRLSVSESSKLFSKVKNTPQPRFVPTAWNIAFPQPKIVKEDPDL